jgi:class 3 adenylate cyclase/tetratricopeptide (TPR) repeat protein
VACSSCGTENPESSKFCRECGARLILACASCGTSVAPRTKFCPECGAPQQVQAEVERQVLAPTAAERRLVSILFADLVGFTPLAESRDPEETRELLGRYFDVAREIVARYGGSVEKFIGDAVMAVWGTPTAHEDDPERAVRAALDMVEAVRHLRGEVGIAELELRAGVLTGEAAVTVGAANQAMVAGDLVNTAARLQSVAPPGGVLVGESTRRATDVAIAYEPVGEAQLKGKATPVTAFRALRVVAQRGGAGRSDTIEPPFVGRDAEFRLIKDLFHATGDERRPRLVSVTGQAGIGKSRLAWELLKYIDGVTELAYWHHGRSPAYGAGVAFWALGEMVRGRAGIAEGEDAASSRGKLRATLEEFVIDAEERRWIEPALQQLLGIAEAEPAPLARETLFAAWRTFFERISERATVVMVFEDLHWADSGLLDFIEHLLDWSRSHPIYVLALARPGLTERRSDWGLVRRNAVSLALEPLPEGPMRELLGGIVTGLSDPVARSILERAEGIPLYAVEIVRMLIAQGRLESADGVYRPVGELETVTLPESLHALIAARLDGLDPADRALLQGASVLGKTFTLEAIAAIAGVEPTGLQETLRSLVRRELLRVDADPRSPERGQYGFVQSLIREVAYSTLGRRERRRLHLAAARHFEGLGDDELAGILATHYVDAYRAQPDGPEGEAVAAQARVALRGAADRAAALGSHLQAFGYLEQALEVTPEPVDRAPILEAAAGEALAAGISTKARQLGEEVLRLRREQGDREPILRATAMLARALNYAGSVEEAVALLERAGTEFGDLVETPAYVAIAAQLSRAYMRTGQHDRAIATADRALPTAERLDLDRDTLELLVNRGTALSHDRIFEGGAVLLGAIELARLRELPDVEIRAIINLQSVVEAEDPRLNQAPRALELVHRFGLRNLLNYLLWNASEAALPAGDWDWMIATEAEWMASAVTEEQRTNVDGNSIAIRIFRGEADEAEIERIWGPWLAASDPQVGSGRLLSLGRLALVHGRLAESHRMAMESLAMSQAHARSAVDVAARAAIWAGDHEAAVRAREVLARHHGRASRNALRTADAGIAALEGRRADALAAYREAIRVWREFGLDFALALTELDMLIALGPEEAEAAALADEARGILTRLGAAPLVKRLDDALVPATPIAPTARTEEPVRR